MDIAPNMIEFAKKYLGNDQSKGKVLLNNGYDLAELKDAEYDLIYSMIVFQHIRSASVVKSYFNEIKRVLKDDGYLRIQVFDDAKSERGKFDEEAIHGVDYGLMGNGYKPEEFKFLLKEHGFDIKEFEHNSPWIWATCIKGKEKNSNNNEILISAIVSAYNSEKFIEGCLDDLVSQTIYKQGQLEIIIIDSASEQNEKAMVQKYQALYPNIIYHRTEEKETLYAAWNRGIKLVRGKYITNANTDDRHKADAFEILCKALDADLTIDLVYSDCKQSSIANETFERCGESITYNYPEFFAPASLLHYQFGPQPMWRKSIHEKIGYFNPNLSAVGDYDFNIRFALAGLKAKKINQVLGLFYLNPLSITNTTENQENEKKYIQNYYTNEANILKFYKNCGWTTKSDLDFANALNSFGIIAAQFKLPWSDKFCSNLELAFLCFISAKKYFEHSDALNNNIVQLHKILKHGVEINPYNFKKIEKINDSENKLSKIKERKEKTITFVAGDNDNFTFANPIMKYLAAREYDIKAYKSNEINESNIRNILEQSDLIWYEWGNGPVIPMSTFHKTCPSICRIHRYEAYEESVSQINWYNIDKLIMINEVFLNVIIEKRDNNLLHKTKVQIIPNPVFVKGKFKERKNNYNIAHISRFHNDKNPVLMIRILQKLVSIDRKYKVFMIGKIQDQQLYKRCNDLINKLELKDNFIYQGEINDVGEWLQDKSFLLSTSLVESQGLAIMEAMAMGIKPIIHNGLGLDTIYPQNLLFKSVEEAVSLITETEYDSYYYYSFIKENYDESIILPQIGAIVNDLISRYSNAENEPIVHKSHTKIDSKPLISICIPTHNRSDYLKEAIKVVLSQKYENYEIVIVDDGSTDNTKEVVESFNSKKIKYIYKKNSGAPDTRNRCIDEANGDFILWLDDDDLLAENSINAYVQLLHNYPDADIIYGELKSFGKSDYHYKYQDWYKNNSGMIEFLFTGSPIPHGGTLIRKRVYEEIGNYDISFRRAHDYQFWSRVALAGKYNCKYLPEIVYYYRIHNNNITGEINSSTDFSYESSILNSVVNKVGVERLFPGLNWIDNKKESYDTAFFNLSNRFFQWNDIANGIKYFIDSMKYSTNTAKLKLLKTLLNHDIIKNDYPEYYKKLVAFEENLKDNDAFEEEQNANYVNICMVTYNRLEYTRQSIDSIKKYTSYPFVLTVIDNNSSDGTKEYLENLKKVGTIKNLEILDENIGVAKAANIGWLKEPEARYYLKLDNDILVQKHNWLSDMVNVIEKIPQAGAVAYNFEPNSYPVSNVNGIDVRVKSEGNLGGACILIPKRTNNLLGFWCEDYGLYGEEDADYGLRISLSNLLNIYLLDENIGIHLPGGKAAVIDKNLFIATDIEEEKQYKQYRLWKDEQRKNNLNKEGIYKRNITDLISGKRSLYYKSSFINEDEGKKNLKKINSHGKDLKLNWKADKEKIQVSIIIPVLNKLALTKKCIKSIFENTDQNKIKYEIIIVDNGSTDETKEFLKEQQKLFKNLKVLLNKQNEGFAKANNIAVSRSAGSYLLFLNNDTEVQKGWLESLLKVRENDNSVAAVGSKLLFPDGKLQHAGVIIIEDKQLPDPLVARHIYWESPSNLKEANKLKTYQALTAACLLVRKELFNE